MRREVLEMLRLQADVNSKIDPAWLQARYPYMRAVLVETTEAMDHHGWKWWSKQTMNLEQLRIELIDIWHFALSQ
ncbi:dUTPase, partial [Corallococcus sp. CA049B]|uniref:dUTPase n=1 Tax=Corallococcus sp. CA049B TaxID=2316730 RepID=UPI0018F2F2B3